MRLGGWASAVVGPACLVLGLAILEISHQLVRIGPFDRAQVGATALAVGCLVVPVAATA